MFERFTDRARRVVVLAQEEARLLNHDHIGTEHLLLGLLHEGEGMAALALAGVHVELEAVRGHVEDLVGVGKKASAENIPFTDRAKKALELALTEALALGHNYIGTEHLLLGLLRETEGVAAQILARMGVGTDALRAEVLDVMQRASGVTEPPARETVPAAAPTCPTCRSALPGQLGWRALEATGDDTGTHVGIRVVYCRRCGAALGLLPGVS